MFQYLTKTYFVTSLFLILCCITTSAHSEPLEFRITFYCNGHCDLFPEVDKIFKPAEIVIGRFQFDTDDADIDGDDSPAGADLFRATLKIFEFEADFGASAWLDPNTPNFMHRCEDAANHGGDPGEIECITEAENGFTDLIVSFTVPVAPPQLPIYTDISLFLGNDDHLLRIDPFGVWTISDEDFPWAQHISGTYDIELISGMGLITADIVVNKNNRANAKRKRLNVAVLTTPDFDATQIDPDSVTFGPDRAQTIEQRIRDADGDGDTDVVFKFFKSETGIECADNLVTFRGETFSGNPVRGETQLRIVPCV